MAHSIGDSEKPQVRLKGPIIENGAQSQEEIGQAGYNTAQQEGDGREQVQRFYRREDISTYKRWG